VAVIPVKTGIQILEKLDSCFRRNDEPEKAWVASIFLKELNY